MDLSNILRQIGPPDAEFLEKARQRTASLVMPPRALGMLHDISERLCAIGRTMTPTVANRAFLVMAGDHGVAAEGVSAFPQEVTGEMVKTFLRGGAGINALAREAGAEVYVVDMGIIPDLDAGDLEGAPNFINRKIRPGTSNMVVEPAMSREEAVAAVEAGFQTAAELFEKGVDILGTGDMGIANTTASAAVGKVITGAGLAEMTGRGTGLDDAGLAHKQEVLAAALDRRRPDPADGLDVLSKVGGFEIGGIAGAVLAAAYYRKPVVVDGFISTAGALIAHALAPEAVGYMFAAHASEEPGHRYMLEHLGLTPVLRLNMRLGEGTGGAVALGVISAAARMFREVMTFEQAAVSGAE